MWRCVSACQPRNDGICVIDASTPDAAGSGDESGPEARVVGQRGVRLEIGARRARCQFPRGELARGRAVGVAFGKKIDSSSELVTVDDDADAVTVSEASNGSAGEGFRADVADAGSGGDAAETGVGEDGDVFAVRQLTQRGGDLVDLLHAGT